MSGTMLDVTASRLCVRCARYVLCMHESSRNTFTSRARRLRLLSTAATQLIRSAVPSADSHINCLEYTHYYMYHCMSQLCLKRLLPA